MMSTIVVGKHSPITARINTHAHAAGAVPLVDAPSGFPNLPAGTFLQPAAKDVMFQNPTGAKKTFEIFNNTSQTIYPIIEGEQVTYPTYDNQDKPGEYREYVGFNGANGYEFGLPANSKISVPVPMAAWDSGRLLLVLNTQVTTDDFLSPTGPFYYNVNALQYVQATGSVKPVGKTGGTTAPGAVLLYHDAPPAVTAVAIANDAPDQLLEYTIRGPSVPVPDGAKKFRPEIDYDISYVDGMYLPAALEAVGGDTGQKGYVGSVLPVTTQKVKGKTVTGFTELVKQFATKQILFGGSTGNQGQAWPQYYLSPTSKPVDLNAPIKLPGGQNIFKESPGNGTYGSNLGILTSGQATAGFPGTNGDYASAALTRLWFSWLNYYQKNVAPTLQNAPPTNSQLTTLQNLFTATGMGYFNFNVPAGDTKYAQEFATTVFTVMNTFSLDSNINTTTTRFVSSTGSSSGNTLTLSDPAVAQALYNQPNHGQGTVVYSSGTDVPNVATSTGNDVVFPGLTSPTQTSISLQTPVTTAQSGNTYSFYFVAGAGQPGILAISPLNQFMGFIYGDNDTDPGIPKSLEVQTTNDVIALIAGCPQEVGHRMTWRTRGIQNRETRHKRRMPNMSSILMSGSCTSRRPDPSMLTPSRSTMSGATGKYTTQTNSWSRLAGPKGSSTKAPTSQSNRLGAHPGSAGREWCRGWLSEHQG